MKSTNFRRRSILFFLSILIAAVTTGFFVVQGQQDKHTVDVKADFTFFSWMYDLAGLEIDSESDRQKMLKWLTDVDGESILESTIFRFATPGLSADHYTVNAKDFSALSISDKSRNWTIIEPSWNNEHYGIWDSVLQVKMRDGTIRTIKVHVFARKDPDGWKLLELTRTAA